ncbi:class I SAM-dependent methyltransferase [Cellulomonas sp. URHB0016]
MNPQHDVRLLDGLAQGASPEPYLPAAGKSWLLPLYDPMTRLGGVGRRHARLVALAGIRPGDRVLDLGCGTGNLALMVARTAPGSDVTGLDPDRPSLVVAARKARRRRVPMTLVRGYGHAVPLPDESVDHVVSSLALHHVDPDRRAATAGEVRRVLRPGGTVTILDFGGDDRHDDNGHGHGHGSRRGHGRMNRDTLLRENLDGGIVRLLTGAGLVAATELEHGRLVGSPVTYVQARRP